MSASRRSRPASAGELRREAPILLPLTVALFAVLTGATLAFYRASVARAAAERGAEAVALAERLLEETPQPPASRLEAWRARLPPGAALALVASDGAVTARAGALDDALPARLVARALATGTAAAGPDEVGSPHVVALVRRPSAGEPALLRLDLLATSLAAEQRLLARWTPFVVVLGFAATLLVVLFFRASMRPYEALLARARAAAGDSAGGERDELDFLLSTFDRALATLGAPGGDLAPLAGTLGRSLDGGFLLLDPERRVLVTTPAAAELLGIASPVAGAPLGQAFAGVPGLASALAASLDPAGPPSHRTLRTGRGDGGRAIGFTAEPLRGEGGRLRGWLVVLADRTESERSEARERLADGLAQLGELSAGVAHELRNGLAVLTGWIDLARRRPQSAETAECLEEIARESRQLARVVDDFLTFARPGTRRLEACDLAVVVRRAASDPAYSPPGVATSLPEGPAPLRGDPLLLERAVRNLLANAVEAVRAVAAESPVEISLAARGEPGRAASWEIVVADRGPGVPAELGERLFEPFVSGRAGGVGLGLALARRIALLHGGELAAEARPGGGSRFVLRLAREGSGVLDT